jgi:hypothetical protein
MEIKVTNVNQAYAEGLRYLAVAGVPESSRNGGVLVAPEPVTTIYTRPTERVLFSAKRDANPFFHLMESLWMLGGRNDMAFPCYFNKRFINFSDDGVTGWGVYGHRWRKWFGRDQLAQLARELINVPNTRRAVLTMWYGGDYFDNPSNPIQHSDLEKAMQGGKDVPCNTHAYFDRRDGRLNMTVLCRSNDIVWGAYGANAVHFSVLLEYMAARVGVPVGVYRQFSNNYHIYTDICGDVEQMKTLAIDAESSDLYEHGKVEVMPLVNDVRAWEHDLQRFMNTPSAASHLYSEPFFTDVVAPMYNAWYIRKEKLGTGLNMAGRIKAQDWQAACMLWIQRRENAKGAAAHGE